MTFGDIAGIATCLSLAVYAVYKRALGKAESQHRRNLANLAGGAHTIEEVLERQHAEAGRVMTDRLRAEFSTRRISRGVHIAANGGYSVERFATALRMHDVFNDPYSMIASHPAMRRIVLTDYATDWYTGISRRDFDLLIIPRFQALLDVALPEERMVLYEWLALFKHADTLGPDFIERHRAAQAILAQDSGCPYADVENIRTWLRRVRAESVPIRRARIGRSMSPPKPESMRMNATKSFIQQLGD